MTSPVAAMAKYIAAMAGAACSVVCLCVLCTKALRRRATRRKGVHDSSTGSEDEEAAAGKGGGPNAAQAFQFNPGEGDLRRFLARHVDHEEPDTPLLALPPSPSHARQADAAREIDRILGARQSDALFGDGPVAEQKAEFRRMVRLLHPDKQSASGDRANLALRRVVEAYRAKRWEG